MRLVYIVTGLSTGGAELMLLKIIQRLDSKYTAHVISLTTLGEVGPSIQALGIPVEAIGMHPGMPNPFAFIRLVRRLRALKPDIVQTWMYHADLLGGLAARLAGIEAIGWGIRNSTLDVDTTKYSTRAVVNACTRTSHWLPKLILSCSEVARKVHVDLGYSADKMVVIPNGFDVELFHPNSLVCTEVRDEVGISSKTLLVGHIGRYHAQKDHKGFIAAAGMVHRRLPKVHFLLAGGGVDETNDQIVRALVEAGVRDVTHLLGLRSDMPRLMSALDVLVSSSAYGEGFPNVIGEAMACGTPCAVTDVGDSAYVIGDTGRLVQAGDVDGLAASIASLLLLSPDVRRELGKRARERVMEFFEIGSVVRQYEEFYDLLAYPSDCRKLGPS